ncbi:Uncharacterised protein [Klebsiella pneumoniae]|uniref:Uncharacterized protein n=1 Tax=Klebsiella pneumoniae TaxID=573 RepID=A0A378B5A6_KLEPN|nr:Uncharacterised protein [Klebsiella pneumoniae]
MPIVGGCRTVPFISCACCRAALRLHGRQNVEGGNRCCRTVPSPFRERVRVRVNGNGVTVSPVEPSLQGLGHQFAEQRHGGGMVFLTRVCRRLTARLPGAGRSPPAGRRLPGMPMRVRIVRPSPACTAAQMPLRLWLTNTTCQGIPAASRQAMARERIRHGLSNITSGSGSPETSRARMSRSGCAIHASGQRPSPGP